LARKIKNRSPGAEVFDSELGEVVMPSHYDLKDLSGRSSRHHCRERRGGLNSARDPELADQGKLP